MPSTSKVFVSLLSTRTIRSFKRDQPEVISTMSPSVKPCAVEVATPGLAFVSALTVFGDPYAVAMASVTPFGRETAMIVP